HTRFSRDWSSDVCSSDLYELLTTWEHLEFIARAFALDGWQPEAEALLRRYHLWEKRDALAATLSKGQRQKLLICGALLHQPEVFLFDEPLQIGRAHV